MSSQQEKIRILILNPNSSKSMTGGMEKSISTLNLPDNIEISYYTAPSDSPASINDGTDVQTSASVVLNDLGSDPQDLKDYLDAVLVCCFSVHPLVPRLSELASSNDFPLSVTGIFEASVLTSLSLLTGPTKKWGIVTTGKYWEDHLTLGVKDFLGHEGNNEKFAGVQTTGLNAGDFHGDIPKEVIDAKLVDATKKLLQAGDVECVVMGCAGMAGLEQIIRRTAIEEYGEERGKKVMVVDGVRAGVGLLAEMVKNRRMFTQ
ncbi:Asp/Glu/hydantoin racemase [Neurospora tetraspora]|uniref:Asp/Glu/hydantoin racemase n=1 Tax=Neurospora tetraspora TaxID=94610 RepID=A0AAE0JM98_9PEZI|nr:Asp/Glu/hydantoin racemase [Neurospora tetraspora]